MSVAIQLADAMGQTGGVNRYRLCGIDVSCDVSLPSLSPFENDRRRAAEKVPQAEPGLVSPAQARYETTGVTGGRQRRVVLETGPDGARIDIAGFGRYALSGDGSLIALERVCGSTTPDLVEDCTLGVPLIVSLALRGCWFLHAAAVAVDGRARVIAGPSGSGKSTLAARLDQESACHRIADDLLGVRSDAPHLHALADYPQLKLSQSGPCRRPRRPPIELDTIYILRPAVDGERFAIRRLERSEKLLAVARHSVASTLFPAVVLKRHMAFCGAVAGAVEMVEIVYPRDEQSLERAVGLIRMADLVGTR